MSVDALKPERDASGRWAPKSSGNPNGRPRKGTTRKIPDVRGILSERVLILVGGTPRKVPRAEARLRTLTIRAMKGNIRAAIKCLKIAEQYGILATPARRARCPGGAVLHIPWEWKQDEFIEMYLKHGDPPWPGERDGLIPVERRTKFNPEGRTVE